VSGKIRKTDPLFYATGHLKRQALKLYAEGKLPLSSRIKASQHLLACRPCKKAFDTLDDRTSPA